MDFVMIETPSSSLLALPSKSNPTTVSPLRPHSKLNVTLTPSKQNTALHFRTKTPTKKSASENKENIDANLQPLLWMEANSVAAIPELLSPFSPQTTPSSPSATSSLPSSTVSPSRLSTPQRNKMKKTPTKRRRQKQLARLY